jgi:hypothetical protein
MTPIFNRTLDAALQRAVPDAAIIAAIDQQRGRLAAIELPSNVDAQTKAAAQTAIAHAFVAGFRAIMLISAALALGGAASAWILIRSSDRNG